MRVYSLLTVKIEDGRRMSHLCENPESVISICGEYVTVDLGLREDNKLSYEQFINLAHRYVNIYFQGKQSPRILCPECISIAYKEAFKL